MIYKPWTEHSGSVRNDLCRSNLLSPTCLADTSSDVYRLIGQGTIEENIYERQSELRSRVAIPASDSTVQKEQRARQLNEGTFERRIHQGIDKGQGTDEQGELFGAHNLFRFDPAGTVSKNVSSMVLSEPSDSQLNRVRLAEDRFLQDLIEAEFRDDGQGDGDVESEDEAGQKTLEERKVQARRRALAKSRATSDAQVAQQLVEGREKQGESINVGLADLQILSGIR